MKRLERPIKVAAVIFLVILAILSVGHQHDKIQRLISADAESDRAVRKIREDAKKQGTGLYQSMEKAGLFRPAEKK